MYSINNHVDSIYSDSILKEERLAIIFQALNKNSKSSIEIRFWPLARHPKSKTQSHSVGLYWKQTKKGSSHILQKPP